ncbi:CAP domain-containing protein [uncultured Ferrimonas sp.]|uniref:CAP domain-containing protein n=1 Tax=uncultured Ferrimonas sp. TaxID=432640 RepID=UPI0026340916|nr:CAP domain-containing protein [uncultured Ferrimonas sp.]
MKPMAIALMVVGLSACGSSGGDGPAAPLPETPPTPAPTPTPPAPVVGCNDELTPLLQAVNAARAAGQHCGSDWYPAVPALSAHAQLQQAALGHSANMANYDFFDHTDLDGHSVADRVNAQGYQWRAVGENIAAGYGSVDAVMAGWLASPGHCRNIMSANYQQLGLACVSNSSSRYHQYWTQVFASPR